jgi:RNA polymerase sigma-70 factor (ECF subfamily)
MSAASQTARAAASGDDDQLAELVRVYYARLHRFGVRACRDSFDAEDAVGEAFLKLTTRPEIVRDPNALSWLFTVVKNACLRFARSLFRQRAAFGEPVAEVSDVASAEVSAEAALARYRLVEDVQRAIATLPIDQREVLVLRDLEGLSGEDVSAMLHIGEAAMKSRLHRARQGVRAALESRYESPNQET